MSKAKGFSARDKKLLIGFLLFSEAFLGYFFLVDPALNAIRRKETELKSAKTNLQISEQLFNSQTIQGSQPVASIPPVFPASPAEASILLQGRINDLAENSGNEVTSISTQEQEGDSRPCALTLIGTYETLSSFIEKLEHPPFLLAVRKISFSSTNDDQNQDRLEAKFDLSLFLKQKDQATASIPL
ncbi:MAG TPA: hypothetical protein DD435_07170 [Cyanobacteria bacterium UBA8530]|nr:hypothetical protein [Cyanobacteria bacterium UBA8530]